MNLNTFNSILCLLAFLKFSAFATANADPETIWFSLYLPMLTADSANPIDSDGDGLTDQQETEEHMTNPLIPDTDGDGLSDGDEVLLYGTNPLQSDTDSDGISDGDEIAQGTNPLSAENQFAIPTPLFLNFFMLVIFSFVAHYRFFKKSQAQYN